MKLSYTSKMPCDHHGGLLKLPTKSQPDVPVAKRKKPKPAALEDSAWRSFYPQGPPYSIAFTEKRFALCRTTKRFVHGLPRYPNPLRLNRYYYSSRKEAEEQARLLNESETAIDARGLASHHYMVVPVTISVRTAN